MSSNIWCIIMIITGIIILVLSYPVDGIEGYGILGIIFIIIGSYLILSKYFK